MGVKARPLALCILIRGSLPSAGCAGDGLRQRRQNVP
jgi:hypothetical protein